LKSEPATRSVRSSQEPEPRHDGVVAGERILHQDVERRATVLCPPSCLTS